MQALDEITRIATHLENDYVAEWLKQDRKIVGYVCSYLPEEILHAADILPYRITGQGCDDTALADLLGSCLAAPASQLAVLPTLAQAHVVAQAQPAAANPPPHAAAAAASPALRWYNTSRYATGDSSHSAIRYPIFIIDCRKYFGRYWSNAEPSNKGGTCIILNQIAFWSIAPKIAFQETGAELRCHPCSVLCTTICPRYV